jgi:hypothetical protein
MKTDPGQADRLGRNQKSVSRLMADGGWHTAEEIRRAGGTEGLRRFRELRKGQDWAKQHVGNGLWAYRLL